MKRADLVADVAAAKKELEDLAALVQERYAALMSMRRQLCQMIGGHGNGMTPLNETLASEIESYKAQIAEQEKLHAEALRFHAEAQMELLRAEKALLVFDCAAFDSRLERRVKEYNSLASKLAVVLGDLRALMIARSEIDLDGSTLPLHIAGRPGDPLRALPVRYLPRLAVKGDSGPGDPWFQI